MTNTPDSPKSQPETLVQIYELLVEMADRVSQRRQAANNFYLSVNTAIIGASAYLDVLEYAPQTWSLGAAGIAICSLWIRNIQSYKTLNSAKFKVINKLEQILPVQSFTEEWSHLDPDGIGSRHTPFHKVEGLVPIVFIAVHFVQLLSTAPWSSLIQTAHCFFGL